MALLNDHIQEEKWRLYLNSHNLTNQVKESGDGSHLLNDLWFSLIKNIFANLAPIKFVLPKAGKYLFCQITKDELYLFGDRFCQVCYR